MKGTMMTVVLALALAMSILSPALADKDGMGKCCMGMMAGKGMGCPMEAEGKMSLDEKFFSKAKFLLANAEELGLTQAQKDKVDAVKLKVKKSLTMKEAEIDVLAMDIMDMLKKDAVDLSAVNKIIDKKYDLKNQKAKELVAGYVELRGVLTKDQLAKAKEIWGKDMKGKMGCMMGDKDCGCPMCARMSGMKHGSDK